MVYFGWDFLEQGSPAQLRSDPTLARATQLKERVSWDSDNKNAIKALASQTLKPVSLGPFLQNHKPFWVFLLVMWHVFPSVDVEIERDVGLKQ